MSAKSVAGFVTDQVMPSLSEEKSRIIVWTRRALWLIFGSSTCDTHDVDRKLLLIVMKGQHETFRQQLLDHGGRSASG